MDLNLNGKVALITGGSHGIGKSIALSLGLEGCQIIICSRDKNKLVNAVRELSEIGVNAVAMVADVLKPSSVKKVQQKVVNKFGKIDVLINNVGGGGRWGTEIFEETSFKTWQEVYDKNCGAAINFTMWAIPLMRQQKWGRVVTISSIYGKEGGGRPWFNLAKAAEISLMKTLAMTPYLARDGITFNTVAPGSIMIPDTGWEKEKKENPKKFNKMLHDKFPLGRLGTPEEIAAVVTFLCSEKASLVNGATIVVDGGESSSF